MSLITTRLLLVSCSQGCGIWTILQLPLSASSFQVLFSFYLLYMIFQLPIFLQASSFCFIFATKLFFSSFFFFFEKKLKNNFIGSCKPFSFQFQLPLHSVSNLWLHKIFPKIVKTSGYLLLRIPGCKITLVHSSNQSHVYPSIFRTDYASILVFIIC